MKAWKKVKFKNKKWSPLNGQRKITPTATLDSAEKKLGRPLGTKTRKSTGGYKLLQYYDHTHNTQAEKILLKFGGAQRLAASLRAIGRPRNRVTIYKWTYPYPKGSGGLIPAPALEDVMVAARHEGIHLSADDLHPTSVVRANGAKFPRLHAASSLQKQLRNDGVLSPHQRRKLRKEHQTEKRQQRELEELFS